MSFPSCSDFLRSLGEEERRACRNASRRRRQNMAAHAVPPKRHRTVVSLIVTLAIALLVVVNSLFLTVSPASAKANDIVNGIDVGSPTDDVHYWGNCQVQDFNGGPDGWVIVSNGYNTPPNDYPVIYTFQTAVVRNGMLFGWFDQGGATGSLGCPTSGSLANCDGIADPFVITHGTNASWQHRL